MAIRQDLSERDPANIRRYVGAIQCLQCVRQARIGLISQCVPAVQCFNASGTMVDTVRAKIVPSAGRSEESVCFDLRSCLEVHIQERCTNSREPEPLHTLATTLSDDSLVCLLSIYGGTGTVKLMARGVLEGEPAQAISSVFILAQAHGISESHNDLTRCFGLYREQIDYLRVAGVLVKLPRKGETRTYMFRFLFVADFKVLVPMFGMPEARGNHPCP